MTPMLTPSTLPLNAQQVVQKIPRHKLGRCSSLTNQNGGLINQGVNRLPYNLAGQRSHSGRMATIATILIRVIPLLGKRNELMREVFWWLVAGREHLMIFFPPKKLEMRTGRVKEASVYFLYLDSVLFCTVHYATLPFLHSAILPFRHSTILLFCHSAIPPFCHSAIPPFRSNTQ